VIVRTRQSDSRLITRFAIQLPGEQFAPYASPLLALAPDGRRLAFISNQHLYIRALDQLDAESIPGTVGAAAPFFSPDGRWIAFSAGRCVEESASRGWACDGHLRCANKLCRNYLCWKLGGRRPHCVYKRGQQHLASISQRRETESLIQLQSGEAAFGPQLLPGHRTVLFTVNAGGLWDRAQIVAQRLDTGARHVIVPAGRDGRYIPSGHLLFATSTTIMGAPVDIANGRLTGTPVPLLEGVRTAPTVSTGVSHFAVSRSGTFAYFPAESIEQRTLVWVDRQGHETSIAAPPHAYRYPRLSPDGTRIAVEAEDGDDDIWIWDVVRATLARLTATPETELSPLWSPDGRFVLFQSTRQGGANIFRQLADGTRDAERLTTSPLRQLPDALTPDGKVLVFRELDAANSYDLRVMSTESDRQSKPLIASRFNEQNADLSPNGRWIVYQSDESGSVEIYVRPFPHVDEGRWIVSGGSGHRPVWARTGREIFYRSADGAMMSVPIREQPRLTIGAPTKLFETPDYIGQLAGFAGGNPGRHYDVTSDGQRFVIVKRSPQW
jgi:eukaryotic-like serine/threonine-protein kinase